MRKQIAFLLTFALLLGIVDTVSLAADEATIPAFTATIANDGTVTVKLDDGVEDYQYAHASFYKNSDKAAKRSPRVFSQVSSVSGA